MLMVMDPQQPNNPYGFIMESPHKHGGNGSLFGNSPKSKILFAILGLIFVLFLYTVVSRVFFNKSGRSEALLVVRAEQQKIIYTASQGLKEAKDDSVLNYTQTVLSSVASDQMNIGELLQKAGVKVDKEKSAVTKNSEIDEALSDAKKNNTYDDTLAEMLESQMKTYQKDLSTAYDQLSSTQAKATVQVAYKSASTVLQ